MIAYTTLGTNNLERAGAFYDKVLGVLGATRAWTNERMIGWSAGAGPMFGVCIPYDQGAATHGNGTMVSLGAKDAAQVKAVYDAAMAAGARDEGAPGPRGNFTLGYFRDPDGNKLAVFFPGV